MPIYNSAFTKCPKCGGEVLLIEGDDSCLKCQRLMRTEPHNPDSVVPDYIARRNVPREQTHCETCCGIKTMVVDGYVVSPFDWPKYGVAADAGCVCG